MKIEQFEDKSLSHYSYAVLSELTREVILIDPARNISSYLVYAEAHQAKITGVIETHPHADFASSHLELHESAGATIYCSKLVDAAYPHRTFDSGDVIESGEIKLKAVNTPGHSPDSISIVLEQEGKDKAVFTGDTLFIGDCGRPDLREKAGSLTAKREELAKQMYHSLRNKLMLLGNDVIVYPAHGAGTLCGKALSEANSSTIGVEKLSNWALAAMDEANFVEELIRDQSFVPQYFPYDVELNKKGAPALASSITKINIGSYADNLVLEKGIAIIDTRPAQEFKKGHLSGAINLMAKGKFETWLGSIIPPGELFYLAAGNENMLKEMILRAAKIGYETFIEAAFVFDTAGLKTEELDLEQFKKQADHYQIIDIRNSDEISEHTIFENSLKIPLAELRERFHEIPLNKPVVVHCAGGYRSAAGSSILQNLLPETVAVYDLSEAVSDFHRIQQQ